MIIFAIFITLKMKKIKILLLLTLILIHPDIESIAQGYWTQKADFGGNARYFGSGMAISNKGYIGLGSTAANPSNDDFWKYDPLTNTWVQISNFTNGRIYSACFSIGDTGYVCSGCYWDGTSGTQPFVFYQDMWAYNPATNSWTQKASFPGTGRNGAIGFEIFGKGYVGMGLHRENSGANTYYNDLYEYDPATNQWTQKASLPASTRSYCINFSIGKYLYVGLGVSNVTQYIPDIWQYNTETDTWTQMNNFPGPARKYASSFVIGSKAYIFGGMNASQYFKDLWEYDPYMDTWTQREDLPSYPRYSAVGFSADNKGYIGTGYAPGLGGNTDELWEYTPLCLDFNPNATLIGNTIYALASGASYQWLDCNNGFAVLPGDTTQSYTPAVSGNYAVIVTQGVCSDTSDCIDICGSLNTNIALSGPTIYALASGASYQWLDCNNGFAVLPGETNQSYTPAISGNYTVIVTQGVCSDTSACMAISICDSINTNVALSGPTIYAMASGASYQWVNCNFGFAVIDNETNQSFTPSVNGNYAVIVSQNACSDTSDCIAFYSGIGEEDNSGVIIYPNPSQTEIIMDLKTNSLKSDIELMDMNGRIVKTFPASSMAVQKLFIGEIPNGNYFLLFNIGSKKVYKEILITK